MDAQAGYLEIYRDFDPPYAQFKPSLLGPAFPQELEAVSGLWFACGYKPGLLSRLSAGVFGRVLMKKAAGLPRNAVPVTE